MSLTNPKNVITEERLAEFYQQILPYLGGMPDLLANKFSKSDLYSADEKIIGRWIDGKPIYQKTVSLGNLPNKTTKDVAHSISNLADIVSVSAVRKHPGDSIFSELPYVHDTTVNYQIGIAIDTTNITIYSRNTDSSPFIGYVTLQYTKTTDSSVEIGNDTDYSTTEKIVGTWIDGKPLYQKTVDTGALPNSATTKQIAHSVANVDRIIWCYGYAYKTNVADGGIRLPNTMNSDAFTNTYADRTNVYIATGKDRSSFTESYVTIQYTKTTD